MSLKPIFVVVVGASVPVAAAGFVLVVPMRSPLVPPMVVLTVVSAAEVLLLVVVAVVLVALAAACGAQRFPMVPIVWWFAWFEHPAATL